MARPARKAMGPAEMKGHCRRSDKAWADKDQGKWLYDEAYQWAIPYRRPAKYSAGSSRIDNLFDETAIASTFHGAGTLKEDLFPSGRPFFKLEPGPIGKKLMGLAGGDNGLKFAQNLANITDQVIPFFQTGEFDQAATEMCIDLYAGTGILIPMRGDDDNPVRWVAPPTDEIALETGGFGDVVLLSWRTMLTRRAIKDQWPAGKYSEDFLKEYNGEGADKDVEICQEWWQDGQVWRFAAYLRAEKGDDRVPIVTEAYRTKPFAAPRYHRVPGETYGRGPIMLALPAIKTVNKAQELTLKAAAIQILGIWGYRPGGTFNPDTARVQPGAFWPMTSTGGVMGPDVTRMDTSTGSVQVGQLISSDLRARIQTVLNDDRLPDKAGSTPISASEVVARMARVKTNYIGAFGRLIFEIIPVIVPRVMEILYDAGLLSTDLQLKPGQLFAAVKVTSPLAQTMKVSHLQPLLQVLQLLEALNQDPNRFFKLDDLLDDVINDLDFDPRRRRSPEERAQVDQLNAQKQTAGAVTEALTRKPEIVANALQEAA